MKSFLLLSEGLIKVPTRMMADCQSIIASQVLGCIDYLLKGKRKQYPEHNKAFILAKKKYNVTIAKFNGQNKFQEVDYNLEGLPDKVQAAFKHQRDVLTVFIDWEKTFIKDESAFGFFADKGINDEPLELIVLNPRRALKYLQSDPSDVFYLIETITSDVRHELMHMVQKLALQYLDTRQIGKKPLYKDRSTGQGIADYLSSPIEFHPQIDSAVDDFMQSLKVTQIKNIDNAIRIYVGMAKPYLSDIQPSSFFRTLRKMEPNKYKKAVIEFYKELKERMK